MYRIVFTKEAAKNFKKLDKRYQKAASAALEKLAHNPKIGDPLKGRLKGLWRLRFSRYRIIYQIIEKKLIVIVFDVDHRRDIYR